MGEWLWLGARIQVTWVQSSRFWLFFFAKRRNVKKIIFQMSTKNSFGKLTYQFVCLLFSSIEMMSTEQSSILFAIIHRIILADICQMTAKLHENLRPVQILEKIIFFCFLEFLRYISLEISEGTFFHFFSFLKKMWISKNVENMRFYCMF